MIRATKSQKQCGCGCIRPGLGGWIGWSKFCSVLQLPSREGISTDGTGSFFFIYNFIKISSEWKLITRMRFRAYSVVTLFPLLGGQSSLIKVKGLWSMVFRLWHLHMFNVPPF